MTTNPQMQTSTILPKTFVDLWLTENAVRKNITAIVVSAAVMFSLSVSGNQNSTNYLLSVAEEHGLTLQQVGFGSISWFGFSIYDASLWTNDGTFEDIDQSLPIALHIIYQREITSDALADRTAEEWEQLNIFSPSQRQVWQRRMTAMWPSVEPGDSITTLVTRDRKTHFYYNEKFIGVIEDESFGSSLLSIWLDANTSQPGLRQQLIGYTGRQP
jgi:hypothetical protein